MKKTLTALVGLLATAAALANTYTVTSTADAGAGTLRQAILDANANPGADTIAFNVVGSGIHTIAPASALPALTGPVTIDGYTQSGSSANTNPTSQGLNTVLGIEIDCTNAGSGGCLGVQADDVTIKGLGINRGTGYAIETANPHQNLVVEGCFIGTNSAGMQALEPYGGGVHIVSQTNARIGGATPAARNLISGGAYNGYQILAAGATTGTLIAGNLIGTDVTGVVKLAKDGMAPLWVQSGSNYTIGGTSAAARNVMVNGLEIAGSTLIQGNYIGTDVTGTIALGCYSRCVNVIAGSSTIGGSAAGAGNRIGGDFTSSGVWTNAAGTIIQGNSIGTDPTGALRLGHSQYGVFAGPGATNTVIGGPGAGEGNVIANNVGKAAIGVFNTTGVKIRGNLLFDNNGLGIELLQGSGDITGVTYNDAGDADTGPNNFQNFPVLSSVTYGGSSTTVAGVLDSAASTVYDVDVYADIECASRPQELPEAKTYLGSTQVTTDGSGHGTFNEVFPIAVAANTPITATATDPGGNTSELAPRFVIKALPRSGSPAGGNQSVYGLDFQAGATVTVGGLPATNVNLQDLHTLTMHTPALPAGSINDIVVSNPGGQSGTLRNGYVADFNDIGGSLFYDSVIQLVANSVTAGIGGGNYGVNNSTLRQQMAVFLLKAKYGVCYAPPPCQSQFPDVACPSTFANWIEALADEGITSGCGGGLYCPTNPVTRQQMAVFLLKAEHGSGYLPPPCDGDFDDVACPGNPFANWIEQLAAEHITAGCAGGQNYCPLNNVTRGQMAAFLVNTFNLP